MCTPDWARAWKLLQKRFISKYDPSSRLLNTLGRLYGILSMTWIPKPLNRLFQPICRRNSLLWSYWALIVSKRPATSRRNILIASSHLFHRLCAIQRSYSQSWKSSRSFSEPVKMSTLMRYAWLTPGLYLEFTLLFSVQSELRIPFRQKWNYFATFWQLSSSEWHARPAETQRQYVVWIGSGTSTNGIAIDPTSMFIIFLTKYDSYGLRKKYLAVNKASAGINSAELGASIAEQFGKSIGPVHRQLRMSRCHRIGQCVDLCDSVSLSSLSHWKIDAAKVLSGQIAIKGYFAGEAAGIRSAKRESARNSLRILFLDLTYFQTRYWQIYYIAASNRSVHRNWWPENEVIQYSRGDTRQEQQTNSPPP